MFGRVATAASRLLAAATSSSVAQAALQQQQQNAAAGLARLLGARGFATNSMDLFNVHRDTPENNANTKFEWSEATLKKAQDIIANYPPNYKASAVIPVLDLVQQHNGGWLSLNAMNAVAKLLEMPEIKVYEVATFYSMFNRSKIGKFHVMVCGTTPCRLQGAEHIQHALEKHLGIHLGETTKDGMFTLAEMECMGACVNAPMIAIADYRNGVEGYSYIYYEDLTAEDAIKIVETLRAGGKPRVGSQYRSKAEPSGATVQGKGWVPQDGVQTLTGAPRGPYAPNLDK